MKPEELLFQTGQAREVHRLQLAEYTYRSTIKTVIEMLEKKDYLDEQAEVSLHLLKVLLETFNTTFEYKEPN